MPLTMYTTTWCGFCRNLKRQLAKAGVELAEVDIERDPAAADFVMSVNGGNQTVPTILFPDGSSMCNPSAAQVQKKLAELATTAAECSGNSHPWVYKIDCTERTGPTLQPSTNSLTNEIARVQCYPGNVHLVLPRGYRA